MCLCFCVCVIAMAHMPWHPVWSQKTNYGWLSPSAMWVSGGEPSLAALAARAFTHEAISLAQELAFLTSPQVMLILQCRAHILRTHACTGALSSFNCEKLWAHSG